MNIPSPAAPHNDSFTVSAFFISEQAINRAIMACLHRGIPRDLIDVAVSSKTSAKFYGGAAGPNRDGWFSWTGRGALAGLLISSAIALVILLFAGYEASKPMAIIQLLGPDLGILIGAALGALYGWLKPGDTRPQMQRALNREDAALMLVHLQPVTEADEVRKVLEQHGSEHVLIEKDHLKVVGAE